MVAPLCGEHIGSTVVSVADRKGGSVIDLYTWSTPNGRKISIALEELGLEYTVHAIDIGKNQQFDPAFLAISPNNKIPAIVDARQPAGRDDGVGRDPALSRGEMRAAAGQRPLGDAAVADAADGRHRSDARPGASLPALQSRQSAVCGRAIQDSRRRVCTACSNTRLGNHEYLADEYSIADIATWPWISRYEWQQIDLAMYPNVLRWYLAIADRPAVQRGYDVPAKVGDIPRPASENH